LLIRTERDDGHRLRLSVQDTGAGFDPRTVDRLFDTFYTTKQDGMGIGLAVSRSIIERHRGRLWATLNDGPGANGNPSPFLSIPTACQMTTALAAFGRLPAANAPQVHEERMSLTRFWCRSSMTTSPCASRFPIY